MINYAFVWLLDFFLYIMNVYIKRVRIETDIVISVSKCMNENNGLCS